MPKQLRNNTVMLLVALMVFGYSNATTNNKNFTDDKNRPSLLSKSSDSEYKRLSDSIYNLVGLENYGLEREVFYNAYKGYQYLLNKGDLLKKKNIITICDYGQSSNNKRLYVIDVVSSRLLFNTFVSHGRNSGQEYATSFSNLPNSNKSSIGFLVTAETYNGKAGYSMRFSGLEAGINDRARSRDIVLHGSHFVNETVVNMGRMIGKSLGCPAVPMALHKRIINAIKGGSCYYAHYPDTWYMQTSHILNPSVNLATTALQTSAQNLSSVAGNLAENETLNSATSQLE